MGSLAQLYTAQYADQPLAYQSALFRLLWGREDPSITALHFYAPIYMMLTICDRHPEREPEAIKTLEAHIRQFNRLYTGGSNV